MQDIDVHSELEVTRLPQIKNGIGVTTDTALYFAMKKTVMVTKVKQII